MHLVSSTDVVCWHLEGTCAFYASTLLLNIITASESEKLTTYTNFPRLVNSPISILTAAAIRQSRLSA